MNTPSELTFGQLWQGDAVSARKELDRVLRGRKLKHGVVEKGEIVIAAIRKRSALQVPSFTYLACSCMRYLLLVRMQSICPRGP